PLSVALRLADHVDVSRGDVIAHPDSAPVVKRLFEATLIWLHERPLDPLRAYLLKHTTRLVPAQVERVHGRTDPETLSEIPATKLELNEIGRVAVSLKRPIVSDPYADNRRTGAFILIDALTNDTVAAGLVAA